MGGAPGDTPVVTWQNLSTHREAEIEMGPYTPEGIAYGSRYLGEMYVERWIFAPEADVLTLDSIETQLGRWNYVGREPLETVPVDATTWGKIKATYGGENQ